jgi:hypothetical protein
MFRGDEVNELGQRDAKDRNQGHKQTKDSRAKSENTSGILVSVAMSAIECSGRDFLLAYPAAA